MNKAYTISLIVFSCFTYFPASSQVPTGHNDKKSGRVVAVVRGERPPVDLDKVAVQDMEPTRIHIKFSEELSGFLDQCVITELPDGTRLFGNPHIDALNIQYHVTGIRQTFYIALQSTEFDQRHRQWGLHLWYDLFVPEGTDIRKMVSDYRALTEVSHSEPVFKKVLTDDPTPSAPAYTPNDPQYSQQWHYHNTGQAGGTAGCDIKLPEAWDLCKGSPNVVVAVIDGGIDFSHPDLAGNMWPGGGYNFVDNTTTISPHAHGTHVAGTISANTNNAVGVSGIAGGSGTGNGVRLMSCQVFTNSSSGGFDNAPIWAADHGACISQNSWAYSNLGEYDWTVLEAIDYFNANGGGNVLNGGITIFAAGNANSSGQWYPACYSGAYAVAGTNNKDIKAWYSNYDTWVKISAPGGETSPQNAGGVLSTVPGNSYAFYQGTSMACPHASGVAALVVSMAQAQLDAQDVRDILTNTTDNIYALNPGYIGMLGSGRLNAYSALLLTQSYLNPSIPLPPQALTASATGTSQINVSWTPNAANDSILLAFNTTGVFGTPVGNYQPGQSIPGGGTVLYKGKTPPYSHTGLTPGDVYFYALWSKSGIYYSAISRKANDTTSCDAITTLPFNEGFEGGPTIPLCWTQSSLYSSWRFRTGNGYGYPAAAHTGTYNACLLDLSYPDNYNKLITPVFDLTNYTDVQLTFWHTQTIWGSDQDQLRIYYRNSNGGSWTLLQTYLTNIISWTQETISLPSVSSYYQVAFEGDTRAGYGVCLDDIQITGTLVPTLTVAPPNQDVSSDAGSTSFNVTSNSAWTVTSNVTWCVVTPGGTGNGTITANYEENNTIDQRIAEITVTVAGLVPVVVTVTQAAGAPTLDVQPLNQDVTAPAGSTSFSVASNSPWTASSNMTWCTVTPSGTGNGSIIADYLENTEVPTRVATITVTVPGLPDQTVTVTQSGIAPTLDVQPSNQDVTALAGSTNFTVTSNTDWTTQSDATWCTATPSGTGNGTLVADYDENTVSSPRVAHITVNVNGLNPETVTVTQDGSTIGINNPGSEGIKIFPNPTSGSFVISITGKMWQDPEITILDITGRSILAGKYIGKQNYFFNLSGGPEGTYFVKIKSDNSVKVVKLILKK